MINLINLTTPLSESAVRSLKVGDEVAISGVLFTGRDAVHKYLHEGGQLPAGVSFVGGILYHCGPVVIKDDQGNWKCVAAGPTTSIREEPYQGDVMRHFNVKGVIGKGGMGAKTLAACQEAPGVYLHAIGGAASLIAQTVRRVLGVYKLSFGVPEAMWVIEVKDFPAVVTMDAHGQSQHEAIEKQSREALDRLLAIN